jgi:hypothetical protein
MYEIHISHTYFLRWVDHQRGHVYLVQNLCYKTNKSQILCGYFHAIMITDFRRVSGKYEAYL